MEYNQVNQNVESFIDFIDLIPKPLRLQGTQFDIAEPWSGPTIEVSQAQLLHYIDALAGAEPVIIGNDEIPQTIPDRGNLSGRRQTHEYLKQHFDTLGLDGTCLSYTTRRGSGCNVQGTLLGTNQSKFVIVSAHLDSVKNPGADDDGSGIAAIMEVARVLSQLPEPEISIRFLGFDQEELGLIGSREYVAQLSESEKSQIVAAIQSDMIGYDSNNDGELHVIDCGRDDSQFLKSAFLDIVKRINLPLQNKETCTNRSDHASFWNENIPAVILNDNYFGGDRNVCYHRPCDKPDLINAEYMTNITQTLANLVWQLANPQGNSARAK